MHKANLIVVEEKKEDQWYAAWNALTQEQRQDMSVRQLIKAMGPLHVNHKDFKERPRSLLPMPNLALPRIEVEVGHRATFVEIVKLTWGWIWR